MFSSLALTFETEMNFLLQGHSMTNRQNVLHDTIKNICDLLTFKFIKYELCIKK